MHGQQNIKTGISIAFKVILTHSDCKIWANVIQYVPGKIMHFTLCKIGKWSTKQ